MELETALCVTAEDALFASRSILLHCPAPPMVGMAWMWIRDRRIRLVDYVAVVDCGTICQSVSHEVQTEAESRRNQNGSL